MKLIIILGCNPPTLDGRISIACDSYKKGDKFLVTGTPRESVYMKKKMVEEYSFDPNIVLMDIQSKTTLDNIMLNREYINTFGTVCLVTSQSHIYRSERLLRLVYKGKIETAYAIDNTSERVDKEYYEGAEKLINKVKRKCLTNKSK